MKNKWLATCWETQSTAYKDCDSTIGVWNDPPVLISPAAVQSTLRIGQGAIHLLDDSSISAISLIFDKWRGKRVACLFDTDETGHWRGEYLLPRYLFHAGILCQRIYPSSTSGFMDENRLPYWAVSIHEFDVVLWLKSEGTYPPVMRTASIRHQLRQFIANGGELYLGGEACHYVPYLIDEAVIREAWLGIQHLELYGDSGIKGRLSDEFACIQLSDGEGNLLTSSKLVVEHHPNGYSSKALHDNGISIETHVCFAAQDMAILEWQVENTCSSQQIVNFSLFGDLSVKGREPVRGDVLNGLVVFDLTERLKVKAYMGISCTMEQDFSWTINDQKYTMGRVKIILPSGGFSRGSLAITLSFASEDPKSVIIQRLHEVAGGFGQWERSVNRWRKTFDKIPFTSGDPEHKALLQRALVTIAGNLWQAPEGLANKKFGKRRILEVQRYFYSLWAPYEAGFYATGLRNFDPALARDQISIFISLQRDDGWIPIVASNNHVTEFLGLSQIPTLAYGAWQTYLAETDKSFLLQIYDGLCRNINWWYAHRQPRSDGVFGFAHGQEGAGDDHPRADECSGAIRSGMKNFISPDACGFVLMEMQCLTHIAKTIGRKNDMSLWRSRIEALNKRTMEVCYDQQDNMFWDVNISTGEFYRCVNPWNFVPLWAGIPIEKELAREMIQNYLLDKLLGRVPFPIVSRDDPAYLPDVYWRGPSWPQLWVIMLQVLWWYGFPQEADNAADRLINMCYRNPYIMEIYESKTGQGISLPEYSFAAAVLFEIILRRYRDNPPWGL